MSFEILPADPSSPLPQALRQIESGRLQTEEAVVNGESYRKTSLVLPLANGDRRELILLLADAEGHLRMLGFHRIRRHLENPEGTTIVFQSGAPNRLTGEPVDVPADTYTYLGLCSALASFDGDRPPLTAHLWVRDRAVAVDIAFDGKETIDVLGSRTPALRVRIRPKDGKTGEALYWLAEAPPHTVVQYRGPVDLLTGEGEATPLVLLRATASSEQVRGLFKD